MPLPRCNLMLGMLIAGIALFARAPAAAQQPPGFGCNSRSAPIGCYWDPIPNPSNDYILLGRSIATGDFDHDGYGDIATGEPNWTPPSDPNGGMYGRVTVVYGAPPAQMPRIQKFLQGHIGGETTQEFALLGDRLAAGDFNGDGFDDLVVFSRWTSQSGAQHYYIPGGVQGLVPASGSILADFAPDLSFDLDQQPIVAGDFDGDGADDLAHGFYGVQGACPPGQLEGRVTIAFGDKNVPFVQRKTVKPAGSAGAGLCHLNFGATLAVGNVAGSPADDLLVGAPGFQGPFTPQQGRVLAYTMTPQRAPQWVRTHFEQGTTFGEFGNWGIAVGDFDGTGYDDVAVGNGRLQGGPPAAGAEEVLVFLNDAAGNVKQQVLAAGAFLLPQDHGSDQMGRSLSALDLDGDGVDDLVIGAPQMGGISGFGLGAIVLARGMPGVGLQSWALGAKGPLGPITLTEFTASEQLGSEFGRALAGVDRDGDGRQEIVVGAPRLGIVHSPTQHTHAGMLAWADFARIIALL